MIGNFGWLTVHAPYLTIVVWTAAIGLVLALGLSVSDRRASFALLLVAAATALLPLVSEYREVPIIGPFWQGRYTLPLAVGVPIVAAYLVGASSIGARLARSRLAVVVAVALGVGQFLGFAQTLRRFTVGYNGPFRYWVRAPWSPPFGALPVTVPLRPSCTVTTASRSEMVSTPVSASSGMRMRSARSIDPMISSTASESMPSSPMTEASVTWLMSFSTTSNSTITLAG